TAVINASLAGVLREAASHGAIGEVLGMRSGIQGVLAGNLVDLSRLDAATIAALAVTPAAALGSSRYRLKDGDSARIVAACREHDVRYFFYIGGNDSADTSHRVALATAEAGYELRVVGVPKTIDNDLPITDHCPGYGSIARFVAAATADGGRDTEASRLTDPVKIVEVMGRNAGWVAAASALGKYAEEDAPHLIYFPERPVILERFVEDVRRVYARHGCAVVVVPETMRDVEGRPLAALGEAERDAFGHSRLAGTASRLVDVLQDRLGIRARFDKPGTIQRALMAAASPVDLAEAELAGRAAVAAAVRGENDKMVTLVREPGPVYACTTGLAPLSAIANQEKKLPPEFIDETGTMVTDAFLAYARPLIGDPLPRYPRI
ncbi:MAG: diphosphate--fructose-6-phosphate 1-phosphotransferase, partial [Chloroflexota bacterium]